MNNSQCTRALLHLPFLLDLASLACIMISSAVYQPQRRCLCFRSLSTERELSFRVYNNIGSTKHED